MKGLLELETSTKQRLQSTIDRLKGQIDQMGSEHRHLLSKVQTEHHKSRQLERNLREAVEKKEYAERRLEEQKRSGSVSNDGASVCLHEHLRLQQEISNLLLRCKEEKFRSRRLNSSDEDDVYYEDEEFLEDEEAEMDSIMGGEALYTSEGDGEQENGSNGENIRPLNRTNQEK